MRKADAYLMQDDMSKLVFNKRRLLCVALALPFFIWFVWYVSTYAQARRDAVRSAAADALSCPDESIKIGSSRQEGDDGPSEVSVEGCGQNAIVLCDDFGTGRGVIGQYFAFDIVCRVAR